MQPLPLASIKWPEAERQLQKVYNIRELNSIQTQTFNCLYTGDTNTFLGAPSGSGKIVSAVLAVLNSAKNYPEDKII